MPRGNLDDSEVESEASVSELLGYVRRLTQEEYDYRVESYYEYNRRRDIPNFETLLSFIEEALRLHRIHLEESGRSGNFNDDRLEFALSAGINSCGSMDHDDELALTRGDDREMQCLSYDLKFLIDPEFEAQRNSSRARSSQPQAGRHAVEPSHRRADARPQDRHDRRRGPPQSNSNRHAGPSRQSGQASRGYGRGQDSRRRYEEESSSDGDW